MKELWVSTKCGESDTTSGIEPLFALSYRRVGVLDGFYGPESVKYDPGLNVWYVSNINGDPLAKDNNGFISRMKPDGTIDSLQLVRLAREKSYTPVADPSPGKLRAIGLSNFEPDRLMAMMAPPVERPYSAE